MLKFTNWIVAVFRLSCPIMLWYAVDSVLRIIEALNQYTD